MSFIETKGMLAKCLATENIVIEHSRTAETASFDTSTRVLTLPVLASASEYVYNMLMGHEVSHALYTPATWAENIPANVPFDFVNVVEDIRIERMIQDKYPGLRRDFSKGYDELNDKDFFGIGDTDLAKMTFIDRLNLHAKLGARAVIPFTPAEQELVDRAMSVTSFDDVVDAAVAISKFVDSKPGNNPGDIPQQTEQPGNNEDTKQSASNPGDEGEEESQQDEPSDDSPDSDNDSEQEDDEDNSPGTEGGSQADERISNTQQHFDNELKKMTNTRSDIMYARTSTVDLDELITDVDDVRSTSAIPGDFYAKAMLDEFLKEIKRDVNFMVNQFEARKSADAYARQQIHKTGVLDTSNLHNYKLTDDLFLRQTITPDGKNHGMVLLLDWSGSMANVANKTVRQIIVLTEFCNKVDIPFEVYLFTSGYSDGSRHDGEINTTDVRIVKVLTSQAKRNQYETDKLNLWSASLQTSISPHMAMGGTPLNSVLSVMPRIIDRFKVQTGAQKVNFVCLTDGESSALSVIRDNRPWYSYYNRVLLRDGVNVVDLGEDNEVSKHLAGWIARKCDVTVTHFFIGGKKECNRYANSLRASFDEKSFCKDLGFATECDGWGLVCFVAPRAFGGASDEMEVEDGANKAQIRKALNKMLATKRSAKVLLSKLVDNFA